MLKRNARDLILGRQPYTQKLTCFHRLTLTVAVWRFIMIRYHTIAPTLCTFYRCHLLILSAYGEFYYIILNLVVGYHVLAV